MLRRLKALVIRYENSWWDIEGREYEAEVATGIISEYELVRQVSGRQKPSALPPSWVHWSPHFQTSLSRGNIKKLNLEQLFGLRLPTSQRMYRFLDKRFYQTAQVEMDLRDFACGHIGLTAVDNVAELKRRLAPALAELEEIGFLARVEAQERYKKVGTGGVAHSAAPRRRAGSRQRPVRKRMLRRFLFHGALTRPRSPRHRRSSPSSPPSTPPGTAAAMLSWVTVIASRPLG